MSSATNYSKALYSVSHINGGCTLFTLRPSLPQLQLVQQLPQLAPLPRRAPVSQELSDQPLQSLGIPLIAEDRHHTRPSTSSCLDRSLPKLSLLFSKLLQHF